jgi:DNA-directed RNA polymerase alpha subunit
MSDISLIKELLKQAIDVIEKAEQGTPQMTPIEKLNLSTRALNCLVRRDIRFIEQLLWLSRRDMFCIRNMGQSTFDEINEKVKTLGLKGWD